MSTKKLFRADLHCHTTCSDGTLSPNKLVELAAQIGLSGLAITDHDTIDAYETALESAKKQNILLGTGVEFSCDYDRIGVHLLGYDFALNSQPLRAFCVRHQQRRIERNQKILTKLEKYKMPMKMDELMQAHREAKTIGRPHIAQLMVKKGYVKTVKEAFINYIADGKCCFDAGEPFSAEETIALIHAAGGKAFLAHPHLIDNVQLIDRLLRLPFDGIECHYAKFAPEIEKKWVQIAQSKKLLMSGGSDFHGSGKQYLTLGASWVDEETFYKIFQRL